MKRLLCLALLCLLLAGCRSAQTAAPETAGAPSSPPVTTRAPVPQTEPEPVPQTEPEPVLTGVWVNEGQYTQGKDFVETMTLQEDGTAVIHLDYQGRDYATLTGQWRADNGVLSVTFPGEDTRDRSYRYALTESTLTLTGDGKEVTYVRGSSTNH